MKIDKDWVANEIETIASWGKGSRGVTRLAFTETAKKAEEYMVKMMEQAGLTVNKDKIGNIIGRLAGKDNSLPAVVTGSHLDTIPEGGKFDGVLGVVGGLAAIHQLKNKGELTHPIELVVFMCEESSRFGFATIGSKTMAGSTNISAWSKARDQDGLSFAEVMSQNNYNIQEISQAVRSEDEIKAFIELHIEQGRVLEKEGNTIGVVEAIAAPTRLKIIVEGVAAHSGATPMEERQDALVSASMIVLAIQEIALEQSRYGTVATVGALKVYPGSINVIPKIVEMLVDIRGVEHESIIECLQDIKDAVSTIAEEQETVVSISMMSADKPVKMDKNIIALIKKICVEKSVPHHFLNSRAGHDAMNMSRLAPTGMIFVPSKGGISHNPEEDTDYNDIMIGIDILTEALYQLAK
jgi:hydantoinase/carbamoylase family amidase